MTTLEDLESTFWDDFTIADCFWEKGIRDTYRRAFKHWKNDIKYITELVLVLNWKWRYRAGKWNINYSKLYTGLREEAHDRCCSNLQWEELKYYLRTVD